MQDHNMFVCMSSIQTHYIKVTLRMVKFGSQCPDCLAANLAGALSNGVTDVLSSSTMLLFVCLFVCFVSLFACLLARLLACLLLDLDKTFGARADQLIQPPCWDHFQLGAAMLCFLDCTRLLSKVYGTAGHAPLLGHGRFFHKLFSRTCAARRRGEATSHPSAAVVMRKLETMDDGPPYLDSAAETNGGFNTFWASSMTPFQVCAMHLETPQLTGTSR